MYSVHNTTLSSEGDTEKKEDNRPTIFGFTCNCEGHKIRVKFYNLFTEKTYTQFKALLKTLERYKI